MFSSHVQIPSDWLDQVGSCVSLACAVHCSIKPLLFILPSIAWLDFLMSPQFESYLLGSGILLALGSVCWGFSKHRRLQVFFYLGAALLLITTGRSLFHGIYESMFVVPGGLIIAGTHVINMRLCHSCTKCPS
ncbi:MAG: MerC domain-containing protein [bacterium]